METDILVNAMDNIELHYKSVTRDCSGRSPARTMDINSAGSDKELTGTPDELFISQPVIDKSQGKLCF